MTEYEKKMAALFQQFPVTTVLFCECLGSPVDSPDTDDGENHCQIFRQRIRGDDDVDKEYALLRMKAGMEIQFTIGRPCHDKERHIRCTAGLKHLGINPANIEDIRRSVLLRPLSGRRLQRRDCAENDELVGEYILERKS